MAKVSVMGAGSWGLGLAILLNNNGHDVKVWSVFPEEIKVLDKERENKKCLPGVHIPEKIEMTADTEYAVKGADVIVLAVASPYTRSTAKLFAPFVKEGQYVVNVGKGIEESTLMTLCQVVEEEIPAATVAALSSAVPRMVLFFIENASFFRSKIRWFHHTTFHKKMQDAFSFLATFLIF